MKIKRRKFIIIILFIIVVILVANAEVIANANKSILTEVEYSDEYLQWIKLPMEERKNTIIPRKYNIKSTNIITKNPLYKAKLSNTNLMPTFNLKDVIPNNIVIKDQMQTNTCWVFAGLSSLETNLALANYKKGTDTSKVYDFSERHAEYATSRKFLNNTENILGYNRAVDSGGDWAMIQSYLTNGTGAIPETQMPFQNNTELIDIEQIQNKTVSSQVYDTINFQNYLEAENEQAKNEIMNQIKQHIQNYGAVYAGLHGTDNNCYNEQTSAKFCQKGGHIPNHAVSIIGWDDNFSIDNFLEASRPSSKGAWIAKNSYGEEAGDNGLIYISYEDKNVSKNMSGIIKASDTVDYENIYQYDQYDPNVISTVGYTNKIILCNVFDKKTQGTEYITQVALHAPETYTCKVYVNPNGASKLKKDMQLVKLKEGETETFAAGYHTIEFAKPIEIKADTFAIFIEIESENSRVALERKFDKDSETSFTEIYNYITVEREKCFVTEVEEDYYYDDEDEIAQEEYVWRDLGNYNLYDDVYWHADSTIKAFTVSEINDDSLKNIEIVEAPNKVMYFEGENFDKTGMVIKANYNNKTSKILDSSSYNITNGTNLKENQTSVTITYEDQSINQTITVEKNSVTDIAIKTQPNKIDYIEGQNFDKTGMIIEITYKSGDKKIISDYIVENGNNLKASQTYVNISYEGKIAKQSINVTPNELIKIEVTQEPNKTEYVQGQNFNKSGMIITGTYKDGKTQEILEYEIEDGLNLTKDQTYITIKYENKTTKQSIVVKDKELISIAINNKPSKTNYIQNKEQLNLSGGTLKINYNDGTSEEIQLTSEEVAIKGFDNTKVGKNVINITYKSKTINLELEIVADKIKEDIPVNSNLENVSCNVTEAKYYTFSNKNEQEYVLMDVVINSLYVNEENDSCEYYYYLSANQDDNNIENYIKIIEKQIDNDKLKFKINTKDIKNYEELSCSNTLYLYIKEVAKKGGNQSVAESKAMKMEMNDEIQIYLDGKKKNDTTDKGAISKPGDKQDNTIAPDRIPNTGKRNIFVLVFIMSIIGIIIYIRYKKIKKYIK